MSFIGFMQGRSKADEGEGIIMREETISGVYHEWNSLKSELHEKFSNRDKITVVPLMEKGIRLLIEVIYWTNHMPALFELQNVEKLEIKPVNLQERLHYILSYPGKYQSYVQLVELFSEMEKLFQKSLIFEQKRLSQMEKNTIKKHPKC